MIAYHVTQTVDTEMLQREGYREHVRDVLNHDAYDHIMKVLSDEQRHLMRVTYREERQAFYGESFHGFPDRTVFYLQLEVGTVHIDQISMRMPNDEFTPTWKVARDAIGELKHRIRMRWNKMWRRK